MLHSSRGRCAARVSHTLADCAQPLITKKAVPMDYVAIDASGLVAAAARLSQSGTSEQRRQRETGRFVMNGLQQLLRQVACRKSLLIALDGPQTLVRAHVSRHSGGAAAVPNRRLERRLTRLCGTALLQTVEERLVRMMPDRQQMPGEVVFAGTCVRGSAEEKMTAWALDLACRDGHDGNAHSLCLIGASELYLTTLALTPFYDVCSVVQGHNELRQVRLLEVLQWLRLDQYARAGDSQLVARARTDLLFLYLLCYGCDGRELPACAGLGPGSFASLLDVYHTRVLRGGDKNVDGRTENAHDGVPAMVGLRVDQDYIVTELPGNVLQVNLGRLVDVLRAAKPAASRASAARQSTATLPAAVVDSYVEHWLQTLHSLCLGVTPHPLYMPQYMSVQLAASSDKNSNNNTARQDSNAHTAATLMTVPSLADIEAYLAKLVQSGVTQRCAVASAPAGSSCDSKGDASSSGADSKDAAQETTTTITTKGGNKEVPSCSSTSSSFSHPFFDPAQPLTAAEYTLLCNFVPAAIEQLLLQYVGVMPKPTACKLIAQADALGALALVREALSYANSDVYHNHIHRCLCFAPSYCWMQNERLKLWRMLYVDLGTTSRQREIRRVCGNRTGVSLHASATVDAPCVFQPSASTWRSVLHFPFVDDNAAQPANHTSRTSSAAATTMKKGGGGGGKVKVVTWNVMFDRYSGQPTPLGMPGIDWCSPQRYPVLAKLIAAEEADIVGMQEVEPAFLQFLSEQPWCQEHYMLSCSPASAVIAPWGVAMLIRRRGHPVVQLQHMNVPAWPGHNALMPVVTLHTAAGALHIAAIHLLAPFTKSNENARTAQDDTLRQRLTASVGGDCIAMGDFNDWPRNEFVMPPETRFVECWPLLHPHDPGKTMDETNTFCKLKIEEIFFGRSDKVFVRSARWKPVAAHLIGTRSVNAENGNTAAPDYLFPSDHYGVSMTFTALR